VGHSLLYEKEPLDHLGTAFTEQIVVRMHIPMLAQVAFHPRLPQANLGIDKPEYLLLDY
jgi:hypothetical protein